MRNIDEVLASLEKSKFRSSFHLKDKDINYIKKQGLVKIKSHTTDFISKRLASKDVLNDGKQTPYKGHPTFIAQHATATCCRGCLAKWYHIPKDRDLTSEEEEYIVEVIMRWISKEMEDK